MVLAVVLVPVAALVGVGLVALWPHGNSAAASASAAFAGPGVTFPHAQVVSVKGAVCAEGLSAAVGAGAVGGRQTPSCGIARVRVRSGVGAGQLVGIEVPSDVMTEGLGAGAGVVLIRTPASGGQPASFVYFDTERGSPLVVLALVFAVLVVAVARLRGLLAMVGLVVAGAVLLVFMLPALLAGSSLLLVGLTGSAAIVFVVLYLAHGVSVRTTTALLGTLFGLALTAVLGVVAVHVSG